MMDLLDQAGRDVIYTPAQVLRDAARTGDRPQQGSVPVSLCMAPQSSVTNDHTELHSWRKSTNRAEIIGCLKTLCI